MLHLETWRRGKPGRHWPNHAWVEERCHQQNHDTNTTTNSILQLIKCGCESSARCSCSRAVLPCTIWCGCAGGLDCSNEHTKTAVEHIPDDEDDHLLTSISILFIEIRQHVYVFIFFYFFFFRVSSYQIVNSVCWSHAMANGPHFEEARFGWWSM